MKPLISFILLLLISQAVLADRVNLVLSNGTIIINAPSGQDWSGYEVVGIRIYADPVIPQLSYDTLYLEDNYAFLKYGTYTIYVNEKALISTASKNRMIYHALQLARKKPNSVVYFNKSNVQILIR